MEVDKSVYEFGQKLLDNFDRERAEAILKQKNDTLDKQIEQQEEALLKPSDQDKLSDKYSKWDKIEQAVNKREQFEKKVEQDKQDLDKQFMDKMMGCDQNHSKEIDIYNRPFKEKMQIVADFKQKGNEYFNQGNYERASYFYAKALLQFYYIIPEDDEQEREVKPIQLACHINQALCFHKQKRYDEGLTECYQALCIDPDNVKALYRQAALNKEKHNFEKALEDVKKGLELDPNNKAFADLHKELKRDIKGYINKSKKVYGKMIEGQDDVDEEPKMADEPKVVEIDDTYKASDDHSEGSTKNIAASNNHTVVLSPDNSHPVSSPTQVATSAHSSELEHRIVQLEKTVGDLKFTIDILRGYGAIPPKMPDEDEQKEIEDRNKDLYKASKSQNSKKKGTMDDCVAITALLLLSVVLSVTLTLLISRSVYTH